jgi:sporulation protein YlmC with PRC-barrel domain
MKITSKKLAPWATAVLCLSLANGSGLADPADASKTSDEKSGQYESSDAEGKLARYDRASGIIGMAVRNQNDEHLGKIKDVVFDFKTERVAYVVMAASGTGVVGFKEKLLAVPMNAFTAGPDNKYLVLRADKAKLEAAAGIDRKNWPSPTNPSWGAEPFWQTDKSDSYKSERPEGTPRSGAPNEPSPKPEPQPENK